MKREELEKYVGELSPELQAKARDCKIEFYNDETGNYEEAEGYMAEPHFRPKERNGITGEILYNGIELEFIKY